MPGITNTSIVEGSYNLLSTTLSLEEIDLDPTKIDSCFVKPSSTTQVKDLWEILTPGPQLQKRLREFQLPITRWRRVRSHCPHPEGVSTFADQGHAVSWRDDR